MRVQVLRPKSASAPRRVRPPLKEDSNGVDGIAWLEKVFHCVPRERRVRSQVDVFVPHGHNGDFRLVRVRKEDINEAAGIDIHLLEDSPDLLELESCWLQKVRTILTLTVWLERVAFAPKLTCVYREPSVST